MTTFNVARGKGQAQAKDLTGRTFGLLTAIRELPERRNGRIVWECRCACGGITDATSQNLLIGFKKTCGCRSGSFKHGDSKSPEFECWEAMHQRCSNPKARGYSRYGGRGISVCERWGEYENFRADMGKRPSLEYTLDRYPNQNGNYEPGNCRWATHLQQQRNMRSNHIVTYRGESLPIAAWAERLGVPYSLLSTRINRGWDVHLAFTKPAQTRRK